MTQMRSQTDEQLAARWDLRPYRYPEKLDGREIRPAERVPGLVFDPRPECIPSITFQQGSRGDSPIRTLKRPPVNPILTELRTVLPEFETLDDAAYAMYQSWCEEPTAREYATPEQIDHARKVLTRLAALA